MASTAQHLGSALSMNERIFHFEGDELTEFLLGSIACDAPKLKKEEKGQKKEKKEEVVTAPYETRKAGRKFSHYLPGSKVPEYQDKFLSPEITLKYGYDPVDDRAEAPVDYNQFRPMINCYLDKYENVLNEPFMLGYLTHLVVDDIYFGKIVPTIVEQNSDNIKEYIKNKYEKYGYKKKQFLSNAEYLDWSHDALYKVFDDYSYLTMFGAEENFPSLPELGNYLEKWEKSDRSFKPSMVEDLNGTEDIKSFLQNPRISKLIVDAKEQLNEGNIINVKDLSFNGLWSYDLYLDMLDSAENQTKEYLNIKQKKI